MTVSLTFDDGLADQLGDVSILQRHGLTGTFYVNSGLIDQPGHLTRAGLTQLAEGGNEIAGHTTLHPDLRTLAPDEVQRQICGDRATLTSWGFHPTSFAYPFGYYNDAVKAAVADCGYTSARRVGGLGAPAPGCPGCIPAETTPAADPDQVRTPAEVTAASTVTALEQTVTDARTHGGGWLPFIFHHQSTCTTCGDLSSNPAVLDGFAGWLADQQQSGAVVVRTVTQVVAAPPRPVTPAGPAPAGPMVVNPSLEAGTDPDIPDCWMAASDGRNTATFGRTSGDAHSGQRAETLTVSGYADGEAKLLPRLDLGQCTPAAAAGVPYTVTAWYRSSAPTQFDLYRRTPTGSWLYWTSSPYLAPSPTWAPAHWTTPPAPPDTTGLATGLALTSNGTLTTDDYAILPAPPTGS